jgi:hypothetical protein
MKRKIRDGLSVGFSHLRWLNTKYQLFQYVKIFLAIGREIGYKRIESGCRGSI